MKQVVLRMQIMESQESLAWLRDDSTGVKLGDWN